MENYLSSTYTTDRIVFEFGGEPFWIYLLYTSSYIHPRTLPQRQKLLTCLCSVHRIHITLISLTKTHMLAAQETIF